MAQQKRPPLHGPRQPEDGTGIEVASGVSAYSGDGFVTLSWGDQASQLTPAEARRHGANLIAAAEAAEHDAAVFVVMRRNLDDGTGQPDSDVVAARFLDDIRDERARRESANG